MRADASADIGYGHFIRTLALADMLKDKFVCQFVTVCPTLFQQAEIRKVCDCIVLSEDTHFEDFLNLLKGDELVILDNYFFSTDYQRKIKERGCLLVCIDDVHDKHYVADAVVNYGVRDITLFSIEPYTRLCLGLEWTPLRSPFRTRNFFDFHVSKINSLCVVVCFGGSDLNDFTGRTVNLLKEIPCVSKIIAIIGDQYHTSKRILSPNIIYKQNLSAQEIATIFYNSDIAYVSSSTICLEAIACHIPVAAGYYVDNQKELYKELVTREIIYPLGDLMEFGWEELIVGALGKKDSLHHINVFCGVKERYNLFFDSLFTMPNHIIDDLIFVDYRNLNRDQHYLLWRQRNDIRIRCWMENQDAFSLEEHFDFIKKLQKEELRIYWGVFSGAEFVGSVNVFFDNINEVERGIFVSPNHFQQSLGTRIEKALEHLLAQLGIICIRAKVLKCNIRSLQFHIKNHYEVYDKNSQYYFLRKLING